MSTPASNQSLATMKARDVPAAVVGKLNGPGFRQMMAQYEKTYIRTGKFAPVFHTIIAMGVVGYSVEWAGRGKYHQQHENH